MTYDNPPIPWSELERRIEGGAPTEGSDGPAYSRKRRPPTGHPVPPAGPVVPYAELHCHSHYSFLDGASSPEELVHRAVELGLSALALTDHDGLYGVVRMAEAAEAYGLPTIIGSELSIGLPAPQNGVADPVGSHLLVLARGVEGYHRLAGAMTEAYLTDGAEKGRPIYDLEALAEAADGHWIILTGCRKGLVRRGLAQGADQADRELHRLVELFGHDNVAVELTDHRRPSDTHDNDLLAGLAEARGLPVVATSAAHYATAEAFELSCAMAAVRARRSLDEIDGWLPAGPVDRLRSGAEMAGLFSRYPDAVANTVRIAEQTRFSLRSSRPRMPDQEVPEGHTPMSWLRQLAERGRLERYGEDPAAQARIASELDVIESKGFAGYFLIVHDIVSFARSRGILFQGRGSAAASAVCYVLGITVVDPVFYGLPFERFLSALREEEPDIDVDFDARRREEVIQYVYRRYGRRNAAQVADVITYRPRNAIRDMAKALGYSQGQQDAWSRQAERWGTRITDDSSDSGEAGQRVDAIPGPVRDLAGRLLGTPRHLGIHSAGMVLTHDPVGLVCPIEPARMENRTVLQWDKEDCAWMGLVKFDLLGLGMLAALQHTFDLTAEHCGRRWTMETIPRNEPGVYDMLCRADTIGVFQVESRAQMGTLPRLRPRCFYDLAVEIGLIRPGPVQGGAVHPYIRRRTGRDPVTYPHPLLEPVLRRTLGIPLFQEQLMQMATTVGGCTPADADLLRRAMGSKRGVEKIDSLRVKMFSGMAANGIDDETEQDIYNRIESFANFGFAESHALSFAVLVYASSWLKLHYPAAYLAGLLRSQPMGFYAPATLVADARRHGVRVLRPDLVHSGLHAGLEPVGEAEGGTDAAGMDDCLVDHTAEEIGLFDPDAPDRTGAHRRDGGFAVRLGLADVSTISDETAGRILAEREHAPFAGMDDLVRRTGLDTDQLEALSLAGVFDDLVGSRRGALWQAGQMAGVAPGQLDIEVPSQPPLLPEPTPVELLGHDLRSTGISTEDHPMRHLRGSLSQRGVLPVGELLSVEPGRRIEVAGVVTHRQRPATAGGITFINLEDETGLLNVIVTPGAWKHYRQVARTSSAMIVRGVLERNDTVMNLYADRLERLEMSVVVSSRDFC
ncbi:error-prone DNA polymerase [Acidipropionibacterium acidipropionici]|uniref:error-prone DNA polymerase n=1 Tax=Acidipropionibacterium acidipropionici TaxID=1748 RepID=UPI00110B7FC5|nr:error-prone DNA polymerase [Acidipropionibacterium acidipropionici]QCV94595.1 error-prone DNA polymerase [Acidipropionibacterium acidipropionici]